MGRPSSKNDLIAAAKKEYDKFINALNETTDEVKLSDFVFDKEAAGKEAHWKRDDNMKDVLIHLNEWHSLLLKWVEKNMLGDHVAFLPKPYNWRSYGEMNVEFKRKHQETTYQEAYRSFEIGHQKVLDLIDTFNNDELFAKGLLEWTGNSTLGQYCTSTTASHYKWALKKLKLHIKTIQ